MGGSLAPPPCSCKFPLSQARACGHHGYPGSLWPLPNSFEICWWGLFGHYFICHCFCSESCPDLQPHRLQNARLFCPSPPPRVCSDSCPISDAIQPSSSLIPFCSCPQSFPALAFFSPISQLYPSGGQSIEALASASVPLPMNIQGWELAKCWFSIFQLSFVIY